MTIRVASVCPSTEKERRGDELIHRYAYPEATLDEAVSLANAFVDVAVELIEKAAEQGAELICLPEGLPNLGRWRFKAPEADRHEAWRRTWDHFCETLSGAARRLGVHVVAGAVEPANGVFYNAAALFDDGGGLVGTYRKVQLACGEDEVLTPGEDFPVFPTRIGKIGMFICWDIMFPEVSHSLMLNGAEILIHPTYGHSGHQADFMAQTRAFDAGCPLVIPMWSGSGRIIDHDGRILAKGHMWQDWRRIIPDQILYADLDLGKKFAFCGHEDFRARRIQERRIGSYAPVCRESEMP